MFLAALLMGCSKPASDSERVFTITFDTGGGEPAPAAQQIGKGGFITEPVEQPVLGAGVFSGWYTQTGLKFNFKSTPVTKDITLVARYWDGPKRYFVINDYDWSYLEKAIASYFGSAVGHDVAVGQGLLFYIFQRPLETHLNTLRRHLELSQEYDVPVLVQLDPITFPICPVTTRTIVRTLSGPPGQARTQSRSAGSTGEARSASNPWPTCLHLLIRKP